MIDLEAEFALARKRIAQAIDRKIHFQARSEGQKRRWRLKPRAGAKWEEITPKAPA